MPPDRASIARELTGGSRPKAADRIVTAAWEMGKRVMMVCAQTGRFSRGKNVPPRKAMGVITKLVRSAWSAWEGNGSISCHRQAWTVLLLLLMAFSGPLQTAAATAGKENMSLAAGMAVNKAQSLMAEEKPGQALAWAKKGLAKKDAPELVSIRDYVLATRNVPD